MILSFPLFLTSVKEIKTKATKIKTKKKYSTENPNLVKPIKTYVNTDISKSKIVYENKGKAGVYRLVNKINGKTYIGSSYNLGKRFSNYFNFNRS